MGNNRSSSWLSMVKRVFKWHTNANHVQPKIKSQAIATAASEPPSDYANVREQFASIVVIQKAFRGYIARRAFRALKGIVKLQALVRGHNARRRAMLALKCIQSLVRVQDRGIHRQCARLSFEGCLESMFNESNALWESLYLQDIRSRKSMIWRSRQNPFVEDENKVEERTKWLDRLMATKELQSHSRASIDKRDSIRESLQLRLANPQYIKEAKCCHSAASSPSLVMVPNYMAATQSAKAKARSRSTPRQRPANPERNGSFGKRLDRQANETHAGIGGSYSFDHNLRNLSFKGRNGLDKESNCSSCYKGSFGGEISPCSTTELRWFK